MLKCSDPLHVPKLYPVKIQTSMYFIGILCNQYKVMQSCDTEKKVIVFKNVTNENLKSVGCICIHSTSAKF